MTIDSIPYGTATTTIITTTSYVLYTPVLEGLSWMGMAFDMVLLSLIVDTLKSEHGLV